MTSFLNFYITVFQHFPSMARECNLLCQSVCLSVGLSVDRSVRQLLFWGSFFPRHFPCSTTWPHVTRHTSHVIAHPRASSHVRRGHTHCTRTRPSKRNCACKCRALSTRTLHVNGRIGRLEALITENEKKEKKEENSAAVVP